MSADERTAPPNRTILQCDVLEGMAQIADGTIDCVVTSPPYYQLRVYHGTDAGAQWGTEASADIYLDKVAALLSEIKRVLKPSGTCWFNVGDMYSSGPAKQSSTKMCRPDPANKYATVKPWHGAASDRVRAKSIMAMPHRILVRAIDDGWICRNDIIWHKLSAVPASMKDRLTTVHEHLFLLTKEPRYWFDLDAIRVPHKGGPIDKAFNRRVRDAMMGNAGSANVRGANLGPNDDPDAYDNNGARRDAPGRQVRLDAPEETAADPRVLRAMARRSVRYDARVIDGVVQVPNDRPQPITTTNRIKGTRNGFIRGDGKIRDDEKGKNPGDVAAVPPDFRPQPLRLNQKGKPGEGGRAPNGKPYNDPRGKNPGDVIVGAPIQSIRSHYGNRTADGRSLCHPDGKNPGDVIVGAPTTMEQAVANSGGYRPQPCRLASGKGHQLPDGTVLDDPRGKNPGDVQNFRRTFDLKGVHVATFPESLASFCIRAGCPPGGVVLDPFMGSGTAALAAEKTGRLWCGIEISPEYISEARRRLAPYENERIAPLPDVVD